MEENIKLTEMELDALTEMGNIGVGNVATDLSKFINKNVDMNIPETKFIPLKNYADEVGGPERLVSGIYLQISGDLIGESMFIFPKKGAFELIDLMMNQKTGTTKILGEMEESAFKEMANILTGSFLNAISKMLDVRLLPSVPHVATDMTQSILDYVLIKVAKHADTVLSIKTDINIEGHNIDGYFIILFDTPSLKKMLNILHKKYGNI